MLQPDKLKKLNENALKMAESGKSKEEILAMKDAFIKQFGDESPKKKDLSEPKQNVASTSEAGSLGSAKIINGLPKLVQNELFVDDSKKASVPKNLRLPNDNDFKIAQDKGEAPPNSEIKYRKLANSNDLYDLNENKATPKLPIKKESITQTHWNDSSIKPINKPTEKQTSKEVKLSLPKDYVQDIPKDFDSESLYNFTEKDKQDLKNNIDRKIEDNDLDLEHPYLYYSSYNKHSTFNTETKQIEPVQKDGFIDRIFGEKKLEEIGINVADFDGFLNKKGYKNEFLDKEEKGLFDGTGNGKENYNIALAKEIEKKRLITFYMGEMDGRDLAKRKLQYKKENLEKNSKESTNIDEITPYTKFDNDIFNQYVDVEMPNLSKKIKEVDAENKEIYKQHKEGNANLLYGAEKFFKKAGYSFIDKVNQIATTIYDKIDADERAQGLRFLNEERQLSRPNTRDIGYAKGLTTEKNGTKYLVTNEGRVIDQDLKIDVTDLLEKYEYDSIKYSAKEENKSDFTFSPQGSIIQFGGVAGDMIVQLALTKSVSNVVPSLTQIPLTKGASSSIITQTTLGYIQGSSETYKLAVDAGINEREARLIANEAGQNLALLYGVTSPMSLQTKATQAIFGTEGKELIKQSVNAYVKTGKKGFLETLKGSLKSIPRNAADWLEEGLVKEGSQELTQQAGESYLVNTNINKQAGQELAKETISADEVINTLIQTTLSGGLAVVPNMFSKTDKLKSYSMLSKDVDFERNLNLLVENGTVTNDQATKLKNNVKIFRNQVNKIPKNLNKDIAMDVMSDLQDISDLEIKKKGLDKSFHEDIDAEIEVKRNNIKSIVKFDSLPKEQKTKLKDQASRELMKELNPDGSKDITITNEQVVERANKIYKTEQENLIKEKDAKVEIPITETEVETEVQEQSKAEKVAEVSPVEDVVTTSVEGKDKVKEHISNLANDNYLFTHVTTEDNARNITENGMSVSLGTGISSTLTASGQESATNQAERLMNGEVVHRDLNNNSVAIISVPKAELDKMSGNSLAEKFENWLVENNHINDKGELAIPKELNAGYLSGQNFITNEKSQKSNNPTDGNVQSGTSVVEQNGITKQEDNATENIPETANVRASESNAEVKIDVSGIGTENYKNKSSQVEGRKREITIADGSKIKGQYKVVSSDDILASHNEENFSKTNGYPTNERGETINDRDYERDKNAQAEVSKIAQDYDGRAIQQTPVVTKEGVVVDGNNRVMSRKLAAKKGTDTKYKEALVNEADMYGINPDDIANVKNPIIVFEAENSLPYTTETLSKFNKQDKKEKSSSGKAVEFSKTLSDKAKRQIAEVYDLAERPSDVTSDVKSVKQLRDILLNNNIIQSNEIPRYFDVDKGVMTKEGVSLMENIALGSAFNEQTINTLSLQGMGDIRNKILQSLVGLINNSKLADEFQLGNEITKAIEVIYQLKTSKQSIDEYLDQPDIFGEKFTPNIDEYAVVLAISDAGFKKWLQNYNNNVGQPDIFKEDDNGITTKRDKSNETITDRKKQVPGNLRSDESRNENENEKENGVIGEKENNVEKVEEEPVARINLSKDLKLDELNKWIAQTEKEIDEFGEENLSMGLPLLVAKAALNAIKLASLTATEVADIISAGLNAVKESDWYKGLSKKEQEDIDANFTDYINKPFTGSEQKKSRFRIEEEVQSLLDDNNPESVILNKYKERREKMIAKDYIERQKELTEDEARKKIDDSFKKADNALVETKTTKEKIDSAFRNVITKIFDRQFVPKFILNKAGGKLVRNYLIASKGATGYAKQMYDEAYDKIYKGLTTAEIKTLDKVIQVRRFIAIDEYRAKNDMPLVVHPDYINTQTSKAYLESLKKELGEQKYDDLVKRADNYFTSFRGLLDDMQKSGLISKESRDRFFDVDYQPRMFMEFLKDNEDNFSLDMPNSSGLSSEQIQKLEDGLDSSLVNDSQYLLSRAMNTRAKSIAMNNTNKRLVEFIEKQKEVVDGLRAKKEKTKKEKDTIKYFDELTKRVKINPIVGFTDTGNPKYKNSLPNGFKNTFYYIDGVKNNIQMENKMHEAYFDSARGIFKDNEVKEKIAIASGTGLVKALATGNNPTFFITNAPRDFLFIATFSEEYGRSVLVNMAKIIKDAYQGVSDIRKSNDNFKNFVKHGGMMDFLKDQGKLKPTKGVKKLLDKVDNKNQEKFGKIFDVITLSKLQTYSEIGFRMAVFNRSVKNQLAELGFKKVEDITDKEQLDDIYVNAVASARGLMDFNQGGSFTKDADAFVPYLNASTQGTRVMFDNLRDRPFETTFRIAQTAGVLSSAAIGTSIALLNAFGSDDDDEKTGTAKYIEAIKGVSKYDRTNYFIVFTGKKTYDGEYEYYRVAKPQQLTPFFSMADGIYTKVLKGKIGDESNTDVVDNVMFSVERNISPLEFSVTGNLARNPAFKSALTYTTGYDFYRDEDLSYLRGKVPVPAEGFESKSVEDFYKKIGEESGMSPVRFKAGVEAFITTPSTSPYVGFLYGGLDAMASDKEGKEVMKKLGNDLLKSTVNRVKKETSDFNRRLENNKTLQKKIEAVEIENLKVRSQFKKLADGYQDGSVTRQQIADEVKKVAVENPIEAKRLLKMVSDRISNKNVSSYVFEVKYAKSAESKALMLVDLFGNDLKNRENLSIEEKKLLNQMLSQKAINREVLIEYNKLVSE